ncbi:MAG: EscR/YscR/HrcR family type III secretion system export apparatus protein [Armatimonadetes bacterium]|nr:EscR/YscR/HrcR family type III secretion system export apparatus protein [Armatimonadota bacterium]
MTALLAPVPGAWAQSPAVAVTSGGGGVELGYIKLMLLLASLSLAPALVAVITSFARIVVVLFFLRAGLGVQEIPPNYVLVGLAVLLTAVAMGPTLNTIYQDALDPLLSGEKQLGEAAAAAETPMREFMSARVRPEDLQLMVEISAPDGRPAPERPPLSALAAAFVISELRAAFLTGFIIYLPFVIIDIVVGSTLASVGMLTLPAPLLALPFKILMFVMVDGWRLLTDALMTSLR